MSFSWRAHFILTAAALLISARMLFLYPSLSYADGPNDWPTIGHDPARTFFNPAELALKPPLRLKATSKTGQEPGAVANGILYGGSGICPQGISGVCAVDAETGTVKWTFPNTTGGSLAAVAGGVLYTLIGSSGPVVALDAATGEFKWSKSVSVAGATGMNVADGLVYVFGYSSPTYALDAATGEVKWDSSKFSGPGFYRANAARNGVLYVGEQWGPAMRALDSQTGDVKWSRTFQNITYQGMAVPMIAATDIVYATPQGEKMVYALDAGTGAVIWTYATERTVSANMALANGMLYAFDGTLFALDAASGSLRWRLSVGQRASSLAVANGVLYAVLHSGSPFDDAAQMFIWAFDAATGAPGPSAGWVQGWYSDLRIANGSMYSALGWYESQPPPVSLQTPAGAVASTSITLSWTFDPGWKGVAGSAYDLQYRDGADGAWADLYVSSTVTSTLFSGQDDHTYYFRARSHTAFGSLGDWGQPAQVVMDLLPPTGSISVESGAAYGNSITATLVLSATDTASGVAGVS
ncbi:MAG: PQQ-binding-like beta-propeller repeat protein, partial [Dehalococcoidia bacterium]|nr:PQQ-binding-like beta-propeller repeat protein [Dehalococcoidia bacterium]